MKKFYPFIPIAGIILIGLSVAKGGEESFNLDNRWIFWGSALVQIISLVGGILLTALT